MPLSPKDLEDRIAKARASSAVNKPSPSGSVSNAESYRTLGFMWRIGSGFITAVVAGGGLGYFLDRWLGTAPIGLISLALLGFAAGVWNVWRTVNSNTMR